MKKTITKFLLMILAAGWTGLITAQQLAVPNKTRLSNSEKSPGMTLSSGGALNGNHSGSLRQGHPQNQTQNIFDIQFNYPMSFSQGVSCVYTGTEFWVGVWANDSIFTLDPAGNITSGFKITGVGTSTSGVRAFAYDGTFLYAAVNTTSIKKIDPNTKTLVGTITVPTAARGLAYDSTANGGAGGFWMSNFNTDFTQISMTGAVLDVITLGEHGVGAVYGIAFDPYTAGGPYIWTFSQGSTNDSCRLGRISVPGHYHTGLIHNVSSDISVPGAIAGSVSVTWRYDPMHYTLMGCTQDATNILFGYELTDYTPPAVDASCEKMDFYPAFLQIPTFLITPMSWDVFLNNNGTDPLNDLETTLIMDDGVTAVYSPAPFHSFGLTPGSSTVASFGNFNPPPVPQMYNVTASTAPVGQVDQDASNDMTSYSMFITDTVMARDNGNATNSLGLPDGSTGVLGQMFEVPYFCYATSATFFLRSPTPGDSVNVDLYSYLGLPDVVIASTPYYVIQPADSDGVVVTLPFNNGSFALNAGTYFLGVNQYNDNITLGTSGFNWRPDAAYFQFTGQSWQTVESNTVPFIICYVLRLNVGDASISVAEIDNRKFQVYPNPASSQLIIEPVQNNAPYSIELYDLIGNKVMQATTDFASKTVLDVSGLSTGMYLVKTTVEGKSTTTKVNIR